MSWLEVLGFVSGAACVWLATRQNVWNFPVGIVNTGLFLVLFGWLTVRPVTWRTSLPGALISAVALQGLQLGSTALIAHKLTSAKATYGNFAAVIVLMSWFYLQAQIVLLAAEVNVVREDKLWPRALTDPPETPVSRAGFFRSCHTPCSFVPSGD